MTSHLGTYRVGQMMPLLAVMVGAGDLLLTNKHWTVLRPLDKVVYDAFLMPPC
jgi:hypothetical protein